MDNIYMKGELLKLDTVDAGEYVGRFEGMDPGKTKITLGGVREIPKDAMDDGTCHFFINEIQNIVKLTEVPEEPRCSLKLTHKDYEHITGMIQKFRYISQVDESYYRALDDLSSAHIIAVGTEGAEMGRKCKLPFLTMSTPNQIYIFDIQAMQYHAFDGGLKKLLESECHKKIIHDCRKLSDCLKSKHNVELKSVFDTQVADIIISKNKTGQLQNRVNSLQDCLQLYLGLTLNIDEKSNMVECSKRPLSIEMKEKLSRSVAFLHKLHEEVKQELMLPFMRGVECYINSIRSCDDFRAWDLCTMDKNIPKEFANAIEY